MSEEILRCLSLAIEGPAFWEKRGRAWERRFLLLPTVLAGDSKGRLSVRDRRLDGCRRLGWGCERCSWSGWHRLRLGAGPEEGVGDGGVRSDLAVGADPRVGDGGAFIYLGCFVNLGNLVTGFEVAADAVGLEVGVAGAEVEPVTLVGVEGSELFFFRQVEKGGDDGNFFVGRNAVEDGGVEAVDSGELMGAVGDAEFVANVGHLIVGDGKMSGGTFAAHREGGSVVRSEVGGDEFVDGDIGEDVAVVDDDGIVRDEGGDVLDAATGFEEVFLVEKSGV